MPKAERPVPGDLVAEEAVLGSLLMDSEVMPAIFPFLTPNDFHRLKHQKVYEACCAVHRRNEPTNQVIVAHELARGGRLELIGGHAFLAQLVATVPTPLHAAHYARIVKEDSIRRQLVHLGGRLVAKAYQETAEAALRWAMAELGALQGTWAQAQQEIEKAKKAMYGD